MDLLDAIGKMHGPQFLVLYGVVCTATIAVAFAVTRLSDQTRGQTPPDVPLDPDPRQLALLRGGPLQVILVTIVDLLERGFLVQSAGNWIAPAPNRPPMLHLTQLESAVFNAFTEGRNVAAVLRSPGLIRAVREIVKPEEESLRSAGLLSSGPVAMAMLARAAGFAVIFGLGCYKLAVALSHGRSNVGFLIMIGLAAAVILFLTTMMPRLSALGRAYVERLELAFAGLRYGGHKKNETPEPIGAVSPDLLLGVGLFGAAALYGSRYADLHTEMKRAEAAAASGNCSSGGSSGCGSGWSSCSSSSCGGGGCGGGGCGGCGS